MRWAGFVLTNEIVVFLGRTTFLEIGEQLGLTVILQGSRRIDGTIHLDQRAERGGHSLEYLGVSMDLVGGNACGLRNFVEEANHLLAIAVVRRSHRLRTISIVLRSLIVCCRIGPRGLRRYRLLL